MNIPLTQEQINSIQIYGKLEGYEYETTVASIDPSDESVRWFPTEASEARYSQMIFKSKENGKFYSFTYYDNRKDHTKNFYNVPELVEVVRRRIRVPASTVEVFTPA